MVGPNAQNRPVRLESPETLALLDTVPDAMVVVDHSGRIVLTNTQAESMFGFRRQELIGQAVEVLIPDRLEAVHANHRIRYFEQPAVRPMGDRLDLLARHQDGHEFPVEIRLSPLETDLGRMISASIRDVTERRRIEEHQRWQREFSSGVIASLPGVFYLIDAQGRMQQWNTNLEAVTGYSSKEIRRMSGVDFFPEAHQPAIQKTISEVFKQGQSSIDAPLRSKDGSTTHYHFVGHRIELGQEPFLTGLGVDITAIRETESTLEYISGMQRLLVDASRRFIASGSSQLDELITDVLGHVGRYCDVDRSYLFRFKADRQLMDNTHEWCAPGIKSEIDHLQELPRTVYPKIAEAMEHLEVMHIPRVADLGPDAATDRAMLEAQEIRSLILVPIVITDELHGFVGFDSVRRERFWTDEEIRLLRVLADLFGVVIDRESAARALRDSEDRYRSVVNNVREVVFQVDSKGYWTFLNPAWREITGYSIDETLNQPIQDYVHQNDREVSARELQAMMRGDKDTTQIEVRFKTRQGRFRWLEVNLRAHVGANDQVAGCAGTMRDITEQRQAEQKMLQLAHYDLVTGLPNRTLALDRLDQLLKASRRTDELVALLFLDLDHFKMANDTLGHEAGDRLLEEAARRLSDNVREQDTVARFGGDEFLVLIGGLSQAVEAQPVAKKLLESFRHPFKLQGRELIFTVSIGIAIAPADGTNSQDLLRNADMAMYESKVEGRNTYHFFTPTMNHDVARRLAIEEQLRSAITRRELTLAFQPILDLSTGAVVAAEALARWHNPVLGEVSPDEFITIAEQNGMIDSIGHYLLDLALSNAVVWQRQQPGFRVSVNVSAQQFRDPQFSGHVHQALRRSGLPGRALQIEVTESILLSGRHQAGEALHDLKKLGVGIAMDDFGTGYASLSYLRNYPFDTLKIDRSFIADVTEDPKDCELVAASLAMAHSLGLSVVAEGVETTAQLALLREHGCTLAQGFLFSKPVHAQAFAEFLNNPEPFLPIPQQS